MQRPFSHSSGLTQATREMQIKTTMRYDFTLGSLYISETENYMYWWRGGRTGALWQGKRYTLCGKQFDGSSKGSTDLPKARHWIIIKVKALVAQAHSLQSHGLKPTKLVCPWISPGKNTGVGCHSLLQGNLPNPGTELIAGRFFTVWTTGEAHIAKQFHT